jgi:hypothetical protein
MSRGRPTLCGGATDKHAKRYIGTFRRLREMGMSVEMPSASFWLTSGPAFASWLLRSCYVTERRKLSRCFEKPRRDPD